jgi:regulator of protease activity HflC (stomatin/prohibitin superfamily)
MFLLILGLVLAAIVALALTIVLEKPVMGLFTGGAIAVATVIMSAFTVISAGHTGVQITLGEVNPVSLTEGVHFVNPISNVREVDVRLQKAELKGANAGTKDLQVVHTDIVVQYRLSASKVPHIYKEFGLNVDDKVLGPAINEAFKSITAKYTSEELITKRNEVSQGIQDHLTAKVSNFNIDIAGISLVNFGFSADYQKAIESKVIATQTKLKAEQDLERIKIEAQQSIAKAKGEAEAIAIQAQAINNQGGAAYVQLQAIEKWNGELPHYMGSGSVPFINIGK